MYLYDQIITIKHSKELQRFLSSASELRTQLLVHQLKRDYLEIMGKEFRVEEDLFIVEIWGHVYASHLAKEMENLCQGPG